MDKGNIPEADGIFDNAPYFNFNNGEIKFNANWVSNVNANYGSASGFLPKYLLESKKIRLNILGVFFLFFS